MIRLTMILLCLILAAAAAGRYKAEVVVREARNEIIRIDRAKTHELAKIQVLRAEIAYLESPDRLAAIAERLTDLKPLSGAQLMTADDFLIVFSEPEPAGAHKELAERENKEIKAVTYADLGAIPTR